MLFVNNLVLPVIEETASGKVITEYKEVGNNIKEVSKEVVNKNEAGQEVKSVYVTHEAGGLTDESHFVKGQAADVKLKAVDTTGKLYELPKVETNKSQDEFFTNAQDARNYSINTKLANLEKENGELKTQLSENNNLMKQLLEKLNTTEKKEETVAFVTTETTVTTETKTE